ncbi:MAG: FtsW/RodA/SpoVE family cell cycle protein [Buchananella hordeovulneris]|nr:FtsW/RodA/SpoVE family cell cycle protein [Buchananella hordeovulneris]
MNQRPTPSRGGGQQRPAPVRRRPPGQSSQPTPKPAPGPAPQREAQPAPGGATAAASAERSWALVVLEWFFAALARPFEWVGKVFSPHWQKLCEWLERRGQSPAADRVLLGATIGAFIVFGFLLTTSVNGVPSGGDDGRTVFGWVSGYVKFHVIGWVGFGVTAAMSWRFLQRYYMPAIFLGISVAVQVYTSFFGVLKNGNRAWLAIGSLEIQPAELHKVMLALYLAWILGREGFDIRKRNHLLAFLLPVFASIGSVLLGRDMGTALMFVAIAAVATWMSGLDFKYVVGVASLAAISLVALVLASKNRLGRFQELLEGAGYPDETGPSQADKAIWAFATGGLQGTGPGQSRFKWGYLEEYRTDYIFAVLGEEYGLWGALTFLLIFVFFIYMLFRIGARSPLRSGQVFAACIGASIGLQGFINMGMTTGMLPVVGVPLPFMSAGGSSLVSTYLALGLVVSVSRATNPTGGLSGLSRIASRRSGAVVAGKGKA